MDWNKLGSVIKIRSLEGWTSYVLITAGLLIVLAIVGISTEALISYRAENLTQTHVLTDKEIGCQIAGDQQKAGFINGQRKLINAFGNSHRESTVKFFTYFYTSYVVFTIFGLIAAISLAVITKAGINNASPHLIAVFLVCTAIVVLYQGAIGVLQWKTNIDNNAKLAVSYANLADQIDTYCVTGKVNVADPNSALVAALPKPVTAANKTGGEKDASPNQTDPNEAKIQPFYVEPTGDQFINYVAWQMEHLRSLSLSIDETKVGIDSKRFLIQ